MSTVDPATTYTISDFIEAGASVTMTYSHLAFIETVDTIEFPIKNVLDDYLVELGNLAITVNLSDSEYHKYLYKPKLLANAIYGNPEVYFVIMALNNVCNVKDFAFRKIKMLKKTDLSTFLTKIYNAESAGITKYNNS